MKKLLYTVLLAFVLSCKGESEAAIDPELMKPLLTKDVGEFVIHLPVSINNVSQTITSRMDIRSDKF